MDYRNKIATMADLLKAGHPNYVLTGPGINEESGASGLSGPEPGVLTKYDPNKIASLTALRSDPVTFYEINLKRWSRYLNCNPDYIHFALARLEQLGYTTGTITQNIDGLHKKAGAENVWEIHGQLRTCYCMKCRNAYHFDFLVDKIISGQGPPQCEKCGGILRPDVVLPEERMNDSFFAARQALSDCHLLLVAGNSLKAYPVANLLKLPKRLIIINRKPTPWDVKAQLVFHGGIKQIFMDLMSYLGENTLIGSQK